MTSEDRTLILKTRITEVDLEIATMLSWGLTHKEIEKKIGMNKRSVEHRMRKLRQSFELPNNLALCVFLNKNNLI